MELETKVKLLEKQSPLERQAFLQIKAIIFDMMIDILKKNIKLTKNSPRTIDHFKHKEQQQ
jgi:hypothetical protein